MRGNHKHKLLKRTPDKERKVKHDLNLNPEVPQHLQAGSGFRVYPEPTLY